MVKKRSRRVIGYCRCSTTEQATEGVSLQVQREKITAYCQLNDLILVDIIEDPGISAKTLERVGFRSMMERLANNEADAIVILKLDRLSRSTRDVLNIVEQIEKQGWELHSISEKLDTATSSGRFVITILSALAQMERELIGERTSMALQHKKSNGDRLGATPLGYETVENDKGENVLQPNANEQKILKRIAQLRQGGMSFNKIAAMLNAESIPTKRGGQWHSSTIQYLVQNIIPKAILV